MALMIARFATKRLGLGLWLTAILAVTFAGCSTGQTAPTTTPPTTTTLSTTTSTSPASEPTLGVLAGVFTQGKGFGEVKPSEFFNGGDPTGLVTHIVWKYWGEPKVTGTGVSEYIAPNQDVAEGKELPATVVAFKLGDCSGHFVYQAVEWYFPQHGQKFNPDQYENICTGAFVTVAPAARVCSPGQIKAANGPFVGGAMGEMSMTITLLNSGPGACWLDGFPKVRLVTATGATLDFRETHGGQYIVKVAARRVLLAVGAMAYVEIAKYRCDLGAVRTASQVQLILPGESKGAILTVPTRVFSYCKGGPKGYGNVIGFTAVESTLGAGLP
jgi:hypothetical protein